MRRFRVKELARARGLTSEELARQSGLKLSTVRNLWQNRVQDPSYSTLAALAKTFGVTIEELVEEVAGDDERVGPRRALIDFAYP